MVIVHIIGADADAELQQELVTHLTSQRHLPLTITTHTGVQPGEKLVQERSRMVQQATVVVVLLSPDLGDRLADGERALKLRLPVVPVLVRAMALEGSEFAGRAIVSYDGKPVAKLARPDRDDGWVQVLRAIHDHVKSAGAPASHRGGGRLRKFRENMGAALKLDRITQWGRLIDLCALREPSTLFLIHGPRAQSIGKFRERIWHYLGDEHGLPHRVAIVPLESAGSKAHTGADWERHLRGALSAQLRTTEGTAADLIRRAAADTPLFLFIGERPFDRMRPDLEAALGAFLSDILPQAVSDADADYPIRALVAAEYSSDEAASLVPLLHQWGDLAHRRGLRYCPLQAILLPTWDDVENYMMDHDPRPAREDIARMKTEYQKLTVRHVSFLELAEALDSFLLSV